MDKWTKLPNRETIERTIVALKNNGFEAEFIETGELAKQRVLELIPAGAEVMTMTSVTAETIGLPKEINESGKFNSIRNQLNSPDTLPAEKKRLGAAPDWVIGSVHAVTEDGNVLIASSTGSQLSAYAYGAEHVIWVVGAQKLVKGRDEGIKRIYEHSLPLESERAKKAYGVLASAVNKILIVDKEVTKDRIHIILINEVLGF